MRIRSKWIRDLNLGARERNHTSRRKGGCFYSLTVEKINSNLTQNPDAIKENVDIFVGKKNIIPETTIRSPVTASQEKRR